MIMNSHTPVLVPLNPGYILLIPLLLIAGAVMKKAIELSPLNDKKKLSVRCPVITELLSVLLFVRFGLSVATIKGIAFLIIAVYASACDIQTRSVADYLSVMVVLVGLTGTSVKQIFFNLVSAFCMLGFLVLCAILAKGQLGGADIKFSAACTFLLGLGKGVSGLMLGLLLSVIGTLIRNSIKKSKDKDLPLVPYLSAAFLISYFV